MNRFKFRVWDKYLKRMDYFELGNAIYHLPSDCGDVMQFTGLFDKHRKDIYEGDIVRTASNHPVLTIFNRVEYTKGRIKWLREAFTVCQTNIGSTDLSEYALCDCCPCALEIIGNKYENPG